MSDRKTKNPVGDRRIKSILDEIRPGFVESGAKTITHEDVGRLVARADEILAEFARSGALRRFAADIGSMVSLVRDHWNGTYVDAPYWTIAVITFTLAYVLKPVDIIPDALPVIGQLDDAIVVGLGLDIVRDELDAYHDWCRKAGK
jgi:uncharacterized membrane protein YkvA (DUF1232 family)